MITTRRYLDYNATAPLRPTVRDACVANLQLFGNPSSISSEGRGARAVVELARDQTAGVVGASREEVCFTSGGTESNQLALQGAIQGARDGGQPFGAVICSTIEHPSVSLNIARASGLGVYRCPVTQRGVVDIDQFRDLVRRSPSPVFASVMAVNNETGVVQPIDELSVIVREAGGSLHCDGVQAIGKIDVKELWRHVDFLSLSGHKLGGLQGAGVLCARRLAPLAAQLLGGGQEFGRRAGTENVQGIVAFGVAAQSAVRDVDRHAEWSEWRRSCEDSLKAQIADCVIFGEKVDRVATTICVGFDGIDAERLVIALDLEGISVSAGAACSSGKIQTSAVLAAMGVTSTLARSAIRVSFGWNTKKQELTNFVDVCGTVVRRMRDRKELGMARYG